MGVPLENYEAVVGKAVVDQLRQLAAALSGARVVHVNSTRVGGGVAEILDRMVPLQRELGLDARWEVITGDDKFYECTKKFHNSLQGNRTEIGLELLRSYEQTNLANAEMLRDSLADADFVFIHDPQPAALLRFTPNRRGKWIWRCHIDASHPYRPVWKYLRGFLQEYDASIWSLAAFVQPVDMPAYLFAPSIDPLSEKNIDLDANEIDRVAAEFGLDRERPIIVQVSRFDRFKDPLGVIEAYRLVREFVPIQLVLAGGAATDDPEGEAILSQVREAAGQDPDIKVLLLPPDAHRIINALQRLADLVVQKSIKEGFGLTVTEAMWKGKPVIGGNAGGIKLQVINHYTGFLVDSPEGAALRIRYLLRKRRRIARMGTLARQFVTENFLLTRQLREHLTLMVSLLHGEDRIELS